MLVADSSINKLKLIELTIVEVLYILTPTHIGVVVKLSDNICAKTFGFVVSENAYAALFGEFVPLAPNATG